MPYRHAGEIGDVWKHLPLCSILEAEKPLRYHETNSAYAEYDLTTGPGTQYGVHTVLGDDERFGASAYIRLLRRNGIASGHYTGSPGLAMSLLGNTAGYHFHDIEEEALACVAAYARRAGLASQVHIHHGDSVQGFLGDYLLGRDDFVFIDPYSPFDANAQGNNFFDVFEKAVSSGAKTLLWYGYDSLEGKAAIAQRLQLYAQRHRVEIMACDAWQAQMTAADCPVNPGVPGCGIAGVHLSPAALRHMEMHLEDVAACYACQPFAGNVVSLKTEVARY